MPTVMWEQRKIEHGFTPILVALRKVLEHFFFEFADMTVGVKHSPPAHGCLQKSESLPFYFLHLGMSNERMGCFGIRVEKPDELRSALQRAFSFGRLAVIDAVSDYKALHPRAWA